jgi:hypothetical protein
VKTPEELGFIVDLSHQNRRDRCQQISQSEEKELQKKEGRGALTASFLKPQRQELILVIDLEGGHVEKSYEFGDRTLQEIRVAFGVKIYESRRLSAFWVKPQVISHGHMKKRGGSSKGASACILNFKKEKGLSRSLWVSKNLCLRKKGACVNLFGGPARALRFNLTPVLERS